MEHSVYEDIVTALKVSSIFKDFTVVKNKDDISFLHSWLNDEQLSGNKKSFNIKDVIDACNLCENSYEKKYGFGEGVSGIMIILNTPPLISEMERQVYKVDSLSLMKKMVEALGRPLDKCYTTNLLKCTVKDTILKPSDILENCINVLKSEMDFVKPKIIIVMGDIISIQNIVHSSRGITWYAVEHPITILKNPELKRKAWNTLKLVIEEMKELGL
jgi:DNA polymerase